MSFGITAICLTTDPTPKPTRVRGRTVNRIADHGKAPSDGIDQTRLGIDHQVRCSYRNLSCFIIFTFTLCPSSGPRNTA